MKILHLIYDHVSNPWVGGGGAVRVFEIYRRLAERHQITMVCGRYPGACDHSEGNLRFKHVGSARGYVLSIFSYAFSAHRYLKKHFRDYDIVIEDFAPWNPVGSFIIKEKPVVLQIQNYLGKEILSKYSVAGLPFYFTERIYPAYFKKWIVLLNVLNERFHIEGKVIPQGVDGQCPAEEQTKETYVAYMGRLDIHQKGLDMLVDAMNGITAELKIAGDGRDRKRLLTMLKGADNIEWVGMVRGEGKTEFLAKAQLLVVPSRFEGQGIVVLEAAACGKPVVVSDIPELKYAVDAGFGISFKTGDAKDLTRKISFLLGRESVRLEMGRKGREYVRNFQWDSIAEEYETFLLETVEKTKRSSLEGKKYS